MTSSRTSVIESIVVGFSSSHIGSHHVFIPRPKADRETLDILGVSTCDPTVAPEVVIYDQKSNWLFLFDVSRSRRYMNEAHRKKLAAHFTPCGKSLVFFSLFADCNAFSRLGKLPIPTAFLRVLRSRESGCEFQ